VSGAGQADRGQSSRFRVDRRGLFRMGCITAGVAASASLLDGLLLTPRRLVTSDHAFEQSRTGAQPPVSPPLRILQVSDLHLRAIGPLERLLIERIHATPADLVVFTGDMIDRPAGIPLLDALLGELPSGARMLAILGNWEHRCAVPVEAIARMYERHGVELLVNRSVEVDHHGRSLRVTGLDDCLLGRPDPTAALAAAAPRDHHLVLAHCPAARDRLGLPPEHPASLVLSGHTHGGQIAPCGAAVVLPPGSGRYVAGWYRDGGPPMYVSRGIGTSLVPIRIGATPELVRIGWRL